MVLTQRLVSFADYRWRELREERWQPIKKSMLQDLLNKSVPSVLMIAPGQKWEGKEMKTVDDLRGLDLDQVIPTLK